jgi:hypothetical protein
MLSQSIDAAPLNPNRWAAHPSHPYQSECKLFLRRASVLTHQPALQYRHPGLQFAHIAGGRYDNEIS